jgi:hypothetical protein
MPRVESAPFDLARQCSGDPAAMSARVMRPPASSQSGLVFFGGILKLSPSNRTQAPFQSRFQRNFRNLTMHRQDFRAVA